MRRTNLSLIYVAAYLLGAGIFLLLAPRLALQLLLSTGDYGEVLPRLVGLLLLGLGTFVVQIIRYRVAALYLTTLAVRAIFCVGFVGLYTLSRDPLFLILLVVVGAGVLATSVSYVLDRRDPRESERYHSSRS
jgi:thiol:disulfide interchange protein